MSSVTTRTDIRSKSGSARLPGHPGLTLATILLSQFMIGLDATVLNVALPEIRSALGFSVTGLAWVTSAYMLTFGGLLLLGGRTGDILGRRRTFMVGLIVFAAASTLGGFAPTAGWLLVARFAQGAAAAFAAPNSLALITANFEEGPRRTRALGMVAGSYAASLVIGLIAGGMIITWASWRWVMFLNVPIAVGMAVLAPLFVNEAERHRARFDLPGGLLSVAGMGSLVYGLLRAASVGWNDGVTIATLLAAAVLLSAFLYVEFHTEQAITPLGLFRNRNRSAGYAILLLLTGPLAAMNFYVTQLLQNVMHYSPLATGIAFLPMGAALMAAGGTAAQLLAKLGHVVAIVAGAVFVIIGMTWLSMVTIDSTYVGSVLGPIILFGAGVGIAMTALNDLILSGVTERESGAASSLLESMQWIGSVVGLALLVTIFGSAARRAAGSVPTAAARRAGEYVLVHGMSAAFVASIFFTVAAAVVTVLTVRLPRPTPKSETVDEGPEDATAAAVPAGVPVVDAGAAG
jgi:EmrB/QacA subfamily drug resistance transporter